MSSFKKNDRKMSISTIPDLKSNNLNNIISWGVMNCLLVVAIVKVFKRFNRFSTESIHEPKI